MSVRILPGDCRAILPALPAGSVQCVVTSPPYWGLRDYGTATWEGGDKDCDHRAPSMREGRNENRPTLGGGIMATNSYQLRYAAQQGMCGKCGARRVDQQLGLEPTPEEYVARMVEVMRAVRRVLRDDGTLFLNMGDSYACGPPGKCTGDPMATSGLAGIRTQAVGREMCRTRPPRDLSGLKQKDLVGMPWRLAFALQADGWFLRADIIWAKPNPMPESVTDRPTKAHEYVFLLTKSARYFYDADAVREPATGDVGNRREFRGGGSYVAGNSFDNGAQRPNRTPGNDGEALSARNLRSVWTIASAPFPEAHFATFPPALASRCILAGSRVGDTILDPFGGSGTVGAVAEQLGRHSILIELSAAYVRMAEERTAQYGLFAQGPQAVAV